MGCDIHFYVETRAEDGTWKSADTWHDKYGDGDMTNYDFEFYGARNYDLFAILANVRNGRGFAGVKTGDGFNPIADPRGVPDDASPEYKAAVERWDGDGHSHSYVTVAELLAYDWTQTAGHQGWVNVIEWARARDNPDGPRSWSGDVMGGNVKHLTADDFEAAWVKLRTERDYPEQRHASAHLRDGGVNEKADIARMHDLLGGGSPYCLVKWTTPYYKSARDFLGQTMPRLWRLGAPEDVRCVFFFDN